MSDDLQELLAAHPAFKRTLSQFMMLYDAAEVLDELKPPNGAVAAEYLREVGNHVIRDAGLPENFLEAMIAAHPPR